MKYDNTNPLHLAIGIMAQRAFDKNRDVSMRQAYLNAVSLIEDAIKEDWTLLEMKNDFNLTEPSEAFEKYFKIYG